MKILVTGSSGLVGKALIDQQYKFSDNDKWVYLTSKDGNLTNEIDVKNIFNKYKPDIVIHLAANVGGLYKNMYKKAEMFEDNILMNTFILKYSRLYNIKKIISILSTCVFPDGIQPLTEDKLHLGPPHFSNEGYAYAKRMLDVHGRILKDENDITTIQLVPTNIFGPYDNFNLEDAHVIPALIHRCYLAKKENKPFIVKGSGKPLRQFIYSYDLATMILSNVYNNNNSGMYICSPPSENEISIADVAKSIANNMNYEDNLVFDTSFEDGQYKKTVEPHNRYKDFKFTNFNDAIKYTVKWFIENYDKRTVRI